MRSVLIAFQAAILLLLAVVGAHSGSDKPPECPALDITAQAHCDL